MQRLIGRDPLLGAIHGTSVELDELRGSIHEIALTQKPAPQSQLLRQALVQVPMIQGVSEQQIERLVGAMELKRVRPREVCVRNGEPSDYMYVVQSGRISFMATNALGAFMPEQVLQPGEVFGQAALDAGGPADFMAVAAGNVELWRLHRRAFKLLQMDFGARLRSVIASVMERKREQELLNKSLVWQEFADVRAAIDSMILLGAIGKGAFGEVQLAVHRPTRKGYALKTVEPPDEKHRALVEREIACMREAASPFLMRFFGASNYPNGLNRMIVEHLGGGSLEEVMGGRGMGKGMDAAKTRFYFACMVAAFDALHAAGWMHRDLSAKNVMVDNHGYAKLIDCGLAKRVGENEHTYTTCGTPVYLAPEVIKATGYGHKAEVWGLGVLLYELYSGCLPFLPPANSKAIGAARRMELYKTIQEAEPDLSMPCFRQDAQSDAVKDLLMLLLRKKASERIGIPKVRLSVFFEGFDWRAFHARRVPAPFVPPRDKRLPEPK